MNNNFSNNYPDFQEAYLETMRESIAYPYSKRLSQEQIVDILRETLDNLPPMEREAFADMSLRNTSEFWPALLKVAVPFIAPLVGAALSKGKKPPKSTPTATKSPLSKPLSTQSPEPPSDPMIAQIAALLNNPQVLQALGQALSIQGSGNAPTPLGVASTPPSQTNVGSNEGYYYNNVDESYFEDISEAVTVVDHRTNSAPNPSGYYWDPVARAWRRRHANYPQPKPTVSIRPSPTIPVRFSSTVPPITRAGFYWDPVAKAWRRRHANYPPPRPLSYQVPTFPSQVVKPPVYNPNPVQIPEPAPNTAASQLLAFMNNPQFSQAMMGQVLGDIGNGNATVQQGNELVDIPFGALMNTLVELGQQASEESVKTGGHESDKYLRDKEGNYRVDDPSNPEERASAVMELFREDYEWRNKNIEESQKETDTSYDPLTEWLISAGMVG